MKTAIKLALIGAALAGGTAAQAATFNVPVTTAGGSDLELFVSDLSNNTYFAQDIGSQLDTIYSKAQVQAGGVSTVGTFTQISTPTSISGLDANLAAFLGATKSTDNVVWTVMAGDRSSTAATLGAQRALFTSTLDLSGVSTNAFTNANISTFTSKLNTFTNGVNTLYAGGNTGSEGYAGTGTIGETNSAASWVSASFGNGASIGTAQMMYMFATNGAGNASASNVYVGGLINIDSAGNITVTNPMSATPIPAAIWLLGSGLAGLVGIGRRRAA